ncbi:MAG: SIMPL domain-containing protein [Gammaproteobacteria bacterium]
MWPIKYNQADNDLVALYAAIERHNGLIVEFLKQRGFGDDEISVSVPAIVDRQAQAYGGEQNARFRYAATSSITVYSTDVDQVRATMNDLVELGKQGLAIAGQDYEARTQFLFTGLNALKPEMIEEATRNAREVAGKFAQDSASTLGKIKTASQGQFSIEDRDSNTPHIKKVRVVSTVEYYLSD